MSQPEDETAAQAQAKLVVCARARDSDAFSILYLVYKPGICGYLFGLVGNEEDAHDLAQMTFLKAWQSLPGLHDVMRFKYWIYRIARNLAYDHGRKRKGTSWLSWEQLEQQHGMASMPGPEERVEQAELVQLALAALPPKFRDCLLLQAKGGFSRQEIAEVMELDEDSVSTYLSYARKQFRHVYRSLEHEEISQEQGVQANE